jgi:hypothetical protein
MKVGKLMIYLPRLKNHINIGMQVPIWQRMKDS